MSRETLWDRLGLAPTGDRKTIRRAYAARLKLVNPEDDPEGFQALRAAYEQALARADRVARKPSAPLDDEPSPYDEDDAYEDDAYEDDPGEDDPPADDAEAETKGRPVDAFRAGVDDERRHHDQLIGRLRQAVEMPGAPDAAALVAALQAVMLSPAMDQLGVFVDTEAWLAGLIAGHLPRTDALVAPAIKRFGWSVNAGDRLANPNITAVARRRIALTELAGYRLQGSNMRGAIGMLEAAPSRPSVLIASLIPGRFKNLRELLRQMRASGIDLTLDFRSDVIDAWEVELARPRIEATTGWLTVGACAVLADVLLVTSGLRETREQLGSAAAFFLYWAGGIAAVLGVFGLKVLLIDKPRKLWREHAARLPAWALSGWWRSGFSLIVMSLLLPGEPWSLGGVALAGAALAWWAAIAGDAFGRGSERLHWAPRWIGRNIPLALLWHAMLREHDPQAPQVAAAVAACALATSFADATLASVWLNDLTEKLRRWILVGACVISGGVVLGLLGYAGHRAPLLLAAALSAMALVQRLPANTGPTLGTMKVTDYIFGWLVLGAVALMGLDVVFKGHSRIAATLVAAGTLTGFGVALWRDLAAHRKTPG